MISSLRSAGFCALLCATCLVATTAAHAQQTPAPAPQQTTTPGAPPPITDQTSATPGQVAPSNTAQTPPLSKKELKAQRKQQKANEKAASESAKAQKDQANALKHQDKATNASEKATTPQQ